MANDSLLKFYYKVLFPYWWRILLLFVFPIIWCASETIAPYLIKVIIDDLSGDKVNITSFSELLGIPILYYFVLMVTIEISIRGCNYVWLQFIPELRAEFRNAILTTVLQKPISFYQNHLIGELVTKFKNLSNSFDLILASFLYGIFPVFISSLIILGFLFYIDRLFAGFFLIWFLGMNIVTFYFANKNIILSDKHISHENLLLGHFGDLFRNIISIKTFQGAELDNEITNTLQNSEIQCTKELEWLTFKIDSIRSIISILVFLSMIILLGWGWQVKRITLGDFSFVTATCFYIRRSVWIASVNLLNLFKEFGIAKESFNDLVASDISSIQLNKIAKCKSNNYDISIESIYFGYDQNHMLFNKLTLYIPEEQNVIVMGTSGSGKTTLMQLIMNLFPIEEGGILIGNTKIEKYLKNNLSKIVYVPQNTELFHRSILDNIRYSNPKASRQEVTTAVKLAEIDRFISGLDNGYNTLVGENGVKLSGGQCQRIALARALLRKPAILILDESTSALDNNMERSILENIIHKTEVKTLIMVSHNHANLDLFDRVLIFENGFIKEDYLCK